MKFNDVLQIIFAELQPAVLAASAVESLMGNHTGEEKQAAAVELLEAGAVGFAVAKPDSSAAKNLQPIVQNAAGAVDSVVKLLNLFGVFEHKAK